MPTRPATLRREKAGSFSACAMRLARKVSPKSRSSLMVFACWRPTTLIHPTRVASLRACEDEAGFARVPAVAETEIQFRRRAFVECFGE